tara:strand:+ start:1297 stop:2295 length:999 start_codon:yes stop_codon:yes gene_type:complete
MSNIKVNAVLDASGGTTATVNGYTPTASNMAGRNRIINGGMVIDQRNAGASVTPTDGTYTLDRWIYKASQASKVSIQQNAGSVTPPAGYTKYLGCTSLSAYTVGAAERFDVEQRIEGLNTADLAWGTASASAITLSFWVRSSLTGTFGGSITNSASNRSYPFTYTISVTNTWEQKSITVAGDTSGTWLTTNGIGLIAIFSLGAGSTYSGTAGAWAGTFYGSATGATSVVGTSGATFYITGVQLEAGSTATDFEYRLYGTELALCQRYYQKTITNWVIESGGTFQTKYHQVTMRTTPTTTGGGSGYVYAGDGNVLSESQTARAYQQLTYSAEL